jgi:hypothetical protein
MLEAAVLRPFLLDNSLLWFQASLVLNVVFKLSGYMVLKPTKASDRLAGTEPTSYNHQNSKRSKYSSKKGENGYGLYANTNIV